MRILLVIKGENSREFSRHFGVLFLLWCTADMVGDIRGYSENAWLDILVSCAHILNLVFTPVILSDHGDANRRAGRFWNRCFTKEDADSEEAALIFDNGRTRSHELMRMAVMPCRLCIGEGWRHWCVVGCPAGLAPKSCWRIWRSPYWCHTATLPQSDPFPRGTILARNIVLCWHWTLSNSLSL